ncbi:S-layer homology domain-containing protein, partial [Oscillospiraceae bacterium OttesenSCG-928-G22]|nr:S-layer homology domain-containing protein [Oscillospiraceae bacterium OttesenSCG-928-G22]
MKKRIVSVVLAIILLFSISPVVFANDYEGHWSAAYIEKCRENAWMLGDGQGNFRPEATITRAEFSTMLWRALDKPEASGTGAGFQDVLSGTYYAEAVTALAERGVVTGYGKRFGPDDSLTREMGITMLARAVSAVPEDADAYTRYADASDTSDWARDAVSVLTERGVVEGVGGNRLAPRQAMKRGEMAKLLVVVFDDGEAPADGKPVITLTIDPESENASKVTVTVSVSGGGEIVFIGSRKSSAGATYSDKSGFADITDSGSFTATANGVYAVCVLDGNGDFVYKLIEITNIKASPGGGGFGGHSGPDGSAGNPFLITSLQELQYMGRGSANPSSYANWTLDRHYKLMTSIKLPEVGAAENNWTPVGAFTLGDASTAFTGGLDGNGHTISGLQLRSYPQYGGLFGYIGENAYVKNLTMADVDILVNLLDVGAIVGRGGGDSVSITNCHIISGSVTNTQFGTGYAAGGIAGVFGGAIEDCSVLVNVSGQTNTGGIVGAGGTVRRCYMGGNVTGGSYVGGITSSDTGLVSDCYVSGNVSGSIAVGGIMGHAGSATIQNCYMLGSVAGSTKSVGGIAGLAGTTLSPTIENCLYLGLGIVLTNATDTAGRILGRDTGAQSGSLSGNKALNSATVSVNSSPRAIDSGAATADGEDMSVADATLKATYEGMNWKFDADGPWTWNTSTQVPELGWQKPRISLTLADDAVTLAGAKPETIGYTLLPADATITITPVGDANVTLDGTDITVDQSGKTAKSVTLVLTATKDGYASAVAFIEVTNLFAGGNGTAGNPYQVTTVNALDGIRHTENLGLSYKLMNGLDLSGWNDNVGTSEAYTPDGLGWEPIGKYVSGGTNVYFTGSLDGNNQTIKNLTINRPGESYMGLFAMVDGTGTMKDLTFTGASITARGHIGTLAGIVNGATYRVENCHVSGSTITANVLATGSDYGGLIATNRGIVTKCSVTGTMAFDALCYRVGGLVSTNSGTVSQSFVTSNINGDKSATGPIAANNTGIIEDCYATGDVTGDEISGGIAGINSGIIRRCYTVGMLEGKRVGGITGYMYSGSGAGPTPGIYNCAALTHSITAGGDNAKIAGQATGTYEIQNALARDNMIITPAGTMQQNGTDTSLADLMTQSTYAGLGWTFHAASGPWVWSVAKSLPVLYWEKQTDIALTGVQIVNNELLVELAGAKAAEITFTTTPADATVTLEGLTSGSPVTGANVSVSAGKIVIDQSGLTAGPVTVRVIVSKPGYESVEKKLRVWNVFAGGNGTSGSPYKVTTPAALAAIGHTENMAFSYELQNNLDLDAAPYNTGEGWVPIGDAVSCFTGTFDGGDYTIENLMINRPKSGGSNQGLFGGLGVGGVVKNLHLDAANVTGWTNVAILAGTMNGGTIQDCSVSGSVTSAGELGNVGGIAGINNSDGIATGGTVSRCFANVAASGPRNVGGIAGQNAKYGTISNCYAAGSVEATGSNAGGIAGATATDAGPISICYSTATVSGNNYVGGILGSNAAGNSLTACVALNPSVTVLETNGEIGRVVGLNSDTGGNVASNLALDTMSVTVPAVDGGKNGTGKTASELQTQNTYTTLGWDFSGDWQMGNGSYVY